MVKWNNIKCNAFCEFYSLNKKSKGKPKTFYAFFFYLAAILTVAVNMEGNHEMKNEGCGIDMAGVANSERIHLVNGNYALQSSQNQIYLECEDLESKVSVTWVLKLEYSYHDCHDFSIRYRIRQVNQ